MLDAKSIQNHINLRKFARTCYTMLLNASWRGIPTGGSKPTLSKSSKTFSWGSDPFGVCTDMAATHKEHLQAAVGKKRTGSPIVTFYNIFI